jgi:parallel beta-helix repeat protein
MAMKITTLLCAALILCSLSPGFGYATTYYIDFAGGNDTNTGKTHASAWKHAPGDTNATGNAGSVTLNPGDLVLFKGGVVYRGSIKIQASGTAGHPITYRGDGWGAEKAILDGSEIMTGWTRCASANECGGNPNWANIYYAYTPAGIAATAFTANLHENNEFLWLAQEPDLPDPFYRDQIAYFYTLPIGAMATTSLTDSTNLNQSDASYWQNSSVMVWHQPNIVTTREILSFNPTTHTITFADVEGGGVYTDRQTYYSIINSIHALDQSGEYYFHPVAEANGTHKIYLWPRDASHLAQGIEISARNYGIDIAVNSHITVEGFIVQKYSGSDLTSCGIGSYNVSWSKNLSNVVVRNNYIRHDSHTSGGYGGVYLSHCDYCTVENNTIEENVLTTGIFITGSDHAITRGNIIRRPGHTGMWYFGNTNSQIVNNTVEDVFGTHGNGITLYLSCNNVLVAWNKLYNAGAGFTYEDSTNLYFYRNLVDAEDGGSNVNDWGGTAPAAGGVIAFLNNTFVRNNRNASLNIGGISGASYVVKNNIIDGGGTDVRSHNLYTGLCWNQEPGYGWYLAEGEFVQTDLSQIFVDGANGNFRLKTGSPAINSGTNISAYLPAASFPDVDFNKDLDGKYAPANSSYDIGAYEYSSVCANKAVTISGTSNYYDSISAAYTAASSWQTVLLQKKSFTENLSLTDNIIVTLKGGYDCNYSSSLGFSTIAGNVTIGGSGSVTIDKVIVR